MLYKMADIDDEESSGDDEISSSEDAGDGVEMMDDAAMAGSQTVSSKMGMKGSMDKQMGSNSLIY